MQLRTFATLLLALTTVACGENSDPPQQPATQELNRVIDTFARDSSEAASLTRRKCASCHALDRNIRKLGPTLKGIFNKAPTISGVTFSTWDEAALDAWLENPRAIKKDTRMAIPGIKDAEERKQIIEYLKLL